MKRFFTRCRTCLQNRGLHGFAPSACRLVARTTRCPPSKPMFTSPQQQLTSLTKGRLYLASVAASGLVKQSFEASPEAAS
ncbi:hypothetical protein BDN71DRAFT_273315 [Pleurotus eryngii]|uniref:Uncharacterized protein n=1 Tax=Pleurotus eryngii TaxID=5323 RepID=A0A9P6A507_PLEER|nr:hypothetical protein BDN71DRAFT_273315 [Pleurotus eryngii]